MRRMKKAATKKSRRSEVERQHVRLFPNYVENLDLTVMPSPYQGYPTPMRVVQTVTTYSACEEPIPNPYKRS
jgi:hypothetical protein